MSYVPHVSMIDCVVWNHVSEIECSTPETGYLYRVLYHDSFGWHNEGNTVFMVEATQFAGELLYIYEFMDIVAVVNDKGLIVWSIDRPGLLIHLQRDIDILKKFQNKEV